MIDRGRNRDEEKAKIEYIKNKGAFFNEIKSTFHICLVLFWVQYIKIDASFKLQFC